MSFWDGGDRDSAVLQGEGAQNPAASVFGSFCRFVFQALTRSGSQADAELGKAGLGPIYVVGLWDTNKTKIQNWGRDIMWRGDSRC